MLPWRSSVPRPVRSLPLFSLFTCESSKGPLLLLRDFTLHDLLLDRVVVSFDTFRGLPRTPCLSTDWERSRVFELFRLTEPRGEGVSQARTWDRCAAGPPHTHPINVYWNMEKVYLKMYIPSWRITINVPCFHLMSFLMQKIISTVIIGL